MALKFKSEEAFQKWMSERLKGSLDVEGSKVVKVVVKESLQRPQGNGLEYMVLVITLSMVGVYILYYVMSMH